MFAAPPCLVDEEVAHAGVAVARGEQQRGVAAVVRLVQGGTLHHAKMNCEWTGSEEGGRRPAVRKKAMKLNE